MSFVTQNVDALAVAWSIRRDGGLTEDEYKRLKAKLLRDSGAGGPTIQMQVKGGWFPHLPST